MPGGHVVADGDGELGDVGLALALLLAARLLLRVGLSGRRRRDDGARLDAGMAEEQGLRLFDVGAGERHLDGGAGLAAGRRDDGEPRAGQQVAR